MHSKNIRLGRHIGAGVLVGAALLTLSLALFQAPDRQDSGVASTEHSLADVRAAHIAFEENRGQSDPAVRFISRGKRYQLYLTAQEAVMVLEPGAAGAKRDVVRIQWQGAASDSVFRGRDLLPTTSRYYRGSDPQQWVSDIASYRSVEYQQLYPGIDLLFYSRQGELEYDFVVAPGTDPNVVRLNIEGADALQLSDAGDLLITTVTGGTLVQKAPLIYQQGPDGREQIDGSYTLTDERLVAFNIGAYDSERALIIDPVLSYSSYLGGSDDESGAVVAADAAGNLYIAAQTRSTDFPPPLLNNHAADDYDIVLTKLDPSNTVLYSTYFGGSARNIGDGVTPLDAVQSIAVSGGAVYVAGYTSTTDFTTLNAFPGIGQGSGGYGPGSTFGGGSSDGYLTRFDAVDGTMVYSTYMGGSNIDRVNGVAIDGVGDVYITGITSSLDYPQVKGFDLDFWGLDTATSLVACGSAANPTICGDVFVSKLSYVEPADPTVSIAYSTLFGGVELDVGNAIAVDSVGTVYIAGMTQSLAVSNVPPVVELGSAFPVAGGAVQERSGGLGDAFVSKISFDAATGTLSLGYSDFIGGQLFDSGEGIALNSPTGGDPNAYVVGMAFSPDFPLNNPVQGNFGGGQSDVFVTKITADGGRSYSTYLGGSADDRGTAIAVRSDVANNALSHVYVTGFTDSTDYPVMNTLRLRYGGGVRDAFVAKLTDSGGAPSLVYSTYLGGSGAETGSGIVVDPVATPQEVVVVGDTASSDFDTWGISAQSSSSGKNDLFLTRIADSGAEADLSVLLETAPDLGIIEQGDQVSFQLTVANSAISDTATGVVVVNILQPGGAFISAT
ncbi:MAG: hypothetical protein GXP10_00665, partial [Gammaproteobacteria bacterium]|nr:hypothetical protein [Gammaproteobacteria bacterium]